MMPSGRAQPNQVYIALYAHGYGRSAILNALSPEASQKTADLTNGLDFSLSPVLGHDLQIDGALTFNLYLRASGPFGGTIEVQISEFAPNGTQTVVPDARVDTPINLSTQITQVTLGVGLVDYEFHAGSAILLHVSIPQTSGTGTPFLVWDNPSAPTGVRLPTISPANAETKYFGERNFGKIFEVGSNGTQAIRVTANLTDAIGVYRFASAVLRLTAQNGSSINLPMNPKNATDYSTVYTVASNFSQGQWQVGLLLHDSSGNDYSFTEPFWVAPFYTVSIPVFDENCSPIQNATLSVGFGNESFWKTVTNASGYGTLSLPDTQVVGPLNLTVSWHGTKSLFPIEVNNPSYPSPTPLWSPLYNASVRITLAGIPLPFARVTLYQTSEVQQLSTGLDGIAKFTNIPAGDYTVRVDYLLTTYQTSLHVGGMCAGRLPSTVPVPLPQWPIAFGIAILVFASVILVLRKRP
jgi:hypothetical protein